MTATSTISTPASTILCGADTADLHGDHRTSPEKCNRGSDAPSTTGLLFKSLSCPQERWRTTPSNQPKSIEQVCTEGTLQDGGYPHSKGPPEARGLAGQGRPERCLFFNTDRPPTQKVSQVYLQRELLPVQLSTIRPVLSSMGSSHSQGERCKANSLHRRYTDTGGVQGLDPRPGDRNVVPPGIPQFHRMLYLLEYLSFIMNRKKSILNPAQVIEFLGLSVDSIATKLRLPLIKMKHI